MTYELWSGTSGNIVGVYHTEHQALAAVRSAAERNGPDYVESLALIVEDDAGESELIAQGRDIFRRLESPAALI